MDGHFWSDKNNRNRCHQTDFLCSKCSRNDPHSGAYSTPHTLAGFGATCKRRRGKSRKEGEKRKGGITREKEGEEEGEEKGEGRGGKARESENVRRLLTSCASNV